MTTDAVISIVKSTPWQIQRFSGYPFYLCAAANQSAWELNRRLGRGYRHFLYLFENGHTEMLYDERDWETVFDIYRNEVKTVAKLRKLEREATMLYKQTAKETAYRREALGTYPFQKLTELVVALVSRISRCVGLGHIIEGLEFGAEREIERIILKRGITDKTVPSRLIASENPSFSLEARKALWSIKGASLNERERKARAFLKKYGWFENSYLGSTHLSLADVLERAAGEKEKPVFSKSAIKEKERLLKTLGFSKEEKALVAAVAFCVNWHDERKARILRAIEAAEPVMEELARRVGMERHVLLHMLLEELTAEKLQSADFLEILARRAKGCAMYATPQKVFIFEGVEYEKIRKAVQSLHVTQNITELTGTIAQGGKVRGIVRLCRHARDVASFPAGFILVAPMTRPEYVPAMRKALAIVTDEGGITSHAAIIARELGKPCIIGTKIATKLLRDGDMVEVDADSGIIRKVGK